MSRWSDLSKEVGLDNKSITTYPTMDQVNEAIRLNNYYRILEWNRFLRSPETNDEIAVMNKIFAQIFVIRKILEQD